MFTTTNPAANHIILFGNQGEPVGVEGDIRKGL
jgi:hypothetical protein